MKEYYGTPYAQGLADENKDERSMFGLAKSIEARMRKLRKTKIRAEINGDKDRVKKINKLIQREYTRFNKSYYEAKSR